MRRDPGPDGKRWFDGQAPQEHIRDGLQLLLRAVLLIASTGCM